MKTITRNNIDFNIPESWMDINFEKFIKMKDFEKRADEFEQNEYNYKYFALLLDKENEDEQISYLTQQDMIDGLLSIYKFTSKDLPIMKDISFKIDDKEFALDKNMNLMTIGRFIDVENAHRDVEWFMEAGAKISACLFREVESKNFITKKVKIKKYNFEDALANTELFKTRLPMPYINSIVVFFLVGANNLLRNLQSYSPKARN